MALIPMVVVAVCKTPRGIAVKALVAYGCLLVSPPNPENMPIQAKPELSISRIFA